MSRAEWGLEGSYGRGSERARERVVGWCSNVWKRGSLAGPIEQCPHRKSKVAGILRAVLRPIFQTVLRGI